LSNFDFIIAEYKEQMASVEYFFSEIKMQNQKRQKKATKIKLSLFFVAFQWRKYF